MEERILEIIFKNSAGSTECITDGLYHKIAAKETATLFREFMEWTGENFIRLKDVWVHRYNSQIDPDNWLTTEQLFDFWYTNIKQK